MTNREKADLQPSLGRAATLDDLDPTARGIVGDILSADALIVGSPVYKGSYAGLFKHLFDLIDPVTLAGKPVLLTATGGGDKHALVIEHQLRPLFAFFEAAVLPTGVYAGGADFCGGQPAAPALLDRLDRAVTQFAPFVERRHAALSTAGRYEVGYRYYRPIPEFLAGFAVTTAAPVCSAACMSSGRRKCWSCFVKPVCRVRSRRPWSPARKPSPLRRPARDRRSPRRRARLFTPCRLLHQTGRPSRCAQMPRLGSAVCSGLRTVVSSGRARPRSPCSGAPPQASGVCRCWMTRAALCQRALTKTLMNN